MAKLDNRFFNNAYAENNWYQAYLRSHVANKTYSDISTHFISRWLHCQECKLGTSLINIGVCRKNLKLKKLKTWHCVLSRQWMTSCVSLWYPWIQITSLPIMHIVDLLRQLNDWLTASHMQGNSDVREEAQLLVWLKYKEEKRNKRGRQEENNWRKIIGKKKQDKMTRGASYKE